jgi:hypothetical protein
MKNKKVTYILIPLTLLIWGLIIFRVIDNFKQPQNADFKSAVNKRDVNQYLSKDTTSLLLNYPDPFLHRNVQSGRSISTDEGSINGENVNLSVVTKAQVVFPLITYSGIIVNSKSKLKTGLVKIASKDYLVKEGETVDGEKILKLYPDSVIILYKANKKTILK